MIRKTVLALTMLAALAACKPAAEKAGDAAATPAAPAAAIQAAGDWSVIIDPAGHTLEFKAGDADVSQLTLTCVPGNGSASIAWGNAQPATLSSGQARLDLNANDAVAGLTDPVMAAFHESGVMEISQGGAKKVLRGSPDGRFAVRAFFQFCSKPQ